MKAKVGIVVPTLGTRPDFLKQNLESIRAAGDAFIAIVAPKTIDASELLRAGLVDQIIVDPNKGLAEAINAGFKSLPKEVVYINWLGDDDLLTKNSLEKTSATLEKNPKAVLAFGACDYIDESGNRIWTNNSGKWAVPLLRFGPDMIPQPGALFRRNAFERVGGLSSSFGWAFDFDLFIKLTKLGEAIYLPEALAAFRWHPESLSVGQRRKSVQEASAVRVSHLPGWMRQIAWAWEELVKLATLWAGNRVSKAARKKAGHK